MTARGLVGWLSCIALLGMLDARAQATPPSGVGAAPDEPGLESLTQELDESVVSAATQTPESSAVVPATVTNITSDELRRYGIHSLDEALNFLSLGMVTQNPLHSVDVGSRGVVLTADFGNHVLLLLDGQILNEPWDGTAYFDWGVGIPWEMIDHIEVVLGPGSVLYGSNAMLGVVNLVTKKAPDFGTVRATVEVKGSSPVNASDGLRSPSFSGDYFPNAGRSVRVAAGGSGSFTLLGRRGEVVGELEYSASHGTAFTFGPQPYGNDGVTGLPKSFGPRTPPGVWGGVATDSSGYRVPSGLLTAHWGDLSLSLRAASSFRATPYSNQFNTFYGDFNTPNDGETDRFLNLELRYGHLVTPRLGVSGRLYGALYDYTQELTVSAAENCPADKPSGCHVVTGGLSRWLGLELQARYDWLLDGRWTTLLGADGRLRRVGGQAVSTDLAGASSETAHGYARDEQVLGVYLQQEATLLPNLRLNAGLRLDVDSRFRPRLSPRAALTYQLRNAGILKAVYAEAFRAPTAYELYYQDGISEVAPSTLVPETVRSAEVSYEQAVGSLRLRGGVFVARFYDMVALTSLTPDQLAAAEAGGQLAPNTTSAVEYENVSSIDNVGVEASLTGHWTRQLSYGLNATLARTVRHFQDGKPATPLTVAPQLFGNARLSYQPWAQGTSFSLATFYAGPRPADRAFDSGFTPQPYAPPEIDLKLSVLGPLPVPGLSYRVTGTYAFSRMSPYVAGPLQTGSPDFPSAQLAPVDRLRVGVQLEERF